MKNLNCILSLCLALSSTAQAQELAEANNYPVNYDKCGIEIVLPPGTIEPAMSRDCKIAYVRPPKKGNVEIQVSLSEGSVRGLCGAYDANFKKYSLKSDMLISNLNRKAELGSDPRNAAEIARLDAVIEKLQDEIMNINDPFKAVSGGTALVTLDASVTQDMLDQFLLANRLLVRQTGLQFKAMPTSGGYLALSSARSGADVNFPETLDVDLNLIPIDGDTKGKKIYKMHDMANGQITLGLGKACDLYKYREDQAAKGIRVSDNDLGRELLTSLAPTFSYSYNLMSTLSYAASIDLERATHVLFESEVTKGEFKINDFSKLLGEGKAGDAFTIDIDLGLLAGRIAPADKQDFVADLISQVRTRLSTKMLEEINAIVPVVDFKPDQAPLVVPQPGTREEFVRMERVCSSKSAFGITYGRECHDQAVTRRVNVDGTLEQILETSRSLNITVSEKVSVQELLPATGNVVF